MSSVVSEESTLTKGHVKHGFVPDCCCPDNVPLPPTSKQMGGDSRTFNSVPSKP